MEDKAATHEESSSKGQQPSTQPLEYQPLDVSKQSIRLTQIQPTDPEHNPAQDDNTVQVSQHQPLDLQTQPTDHDDSMNQDQGMDQATSMDEDDTSDQGDSTAQRFQHQPLDLSQRSIRLIQVQPTNQDDSLIECTLRHDTAASAYACVSYVWGEDNESRTISINGRMLKVGQNLWEFLRAWGKKQHLVHKWLWIDFLCIDQTNLTERNHQVQQMGAIYSDATEVYAWLGQDALVAQFLESPDLSHVIDDPSVSEMASIAVVGARLKAFMDLRYWTRAWITQELALARKVVLLADQSELAMAELPFWTQNLNAVFRKLSEANVRGYHKTGLINLRARRSRIVAFDPSNAHLMRGRSLLSLLDQFKDKKCQVRRDRVFSLLALCGDGSSLHVDYGGSDEKLLANVLLSCKKSFCLCAVAVALQALGPNYRKFNGPEFNTPFAQLRIPAKQRDPVESSTSNPTLPPSHSIPFLIYSDEEISFPLYCLCKRFKKRDMLNIQHGNSTWKLDFPGPTSLQKDRSSVYTTQDRNDNPEVLVHFSLVDLVSICHPRYTFVNSACKRVKQQGTSDEYNEHGLSFQLCNE